MSELIHDNRRCVTSLGTHNEPDANGHCSWCGRKIAPKRFRPKPPVGYVNDMDEYYNMFYNPDYNA